MFDTPTIFQRYQLFDARSGGLFITPYLCGFKNVIEGENDNFL